MVNRIILNETSYHGAGAVQAIVAELAAKGLKKPIVFSDPDLIKFGVTKKVTDLLDKAGIAYEIYSNIQPNPTIENVQGGVAAAKKAAFEAAHKLVEDVGIKAKCPEIREEDLDSISRDALKDACYPGNPREATQDEVKALFRKLM